MATECHGCGREYSKLALHWRGEKYDCDFPEPTHREREIIEGLMLSDGSLSRSNSLPYLQVSLKNELFIEWLSNELDRFGASYDLVETASEVAERVNSSDWGDGRTTVEDCNDIFQLRTSIHPVFEEYESWYKNGTKHFPDQLDISPLVVKVWYVCDGDLKNVNRDSHSVKPRITSRTESERSEWLLGLFEDKGFSPYWDELPSKVCFRVSEVEDFFDWIGEPLPGFEYKWPEG